ncbi:MAG: ion channel [Pseudomonadota bacterium]
MRNYRVLIGMGGVPPHDNPQAYVWEHRLHWLMVAVALLALPAFYFEEVATNGLLRHVGQALDAFILLAFSAEFFWMLRQTRQPRLYVAYNWLDLLIIFAAAISFAGVASEWVPLARLLRIAYVTLVLARALGSMRNVLSPTSLPYFLGWGAVTLALAGAGFYWLEPTIHSYGDGLWLAFVTGATVGYGDFVPTTAASRFFAVIMVIAGFAMLSLVTASIAAYFIGEDEKILRREMHQDIKALREEVAKLRTDIAELSGKRPE